MEPHTLSFVHFCSAFNHLELFWSCLHICLKMWKRHELLVSRNHNFNMLQPWSFLLHTHIAHTKINIHVDFEASMYRNKKVMDCPKSLKMPFLLPASILNVNGLVYTLFFDSGFWIGLATFFVVLFSFPETREVQDLFVVNLGLRSRSHECYKQTVET